MSDSFIIQLYTISQAAELLSVSKETVYRLTESRALPFYKIKGCVRIAHADLMTYLENNRKESGS